MNSFFTGRLSTIKDFVGTQTLPLHDWGRLFSWNYWTEGPLDSFSPYYLIGCLGIFVLIVILLIWRFRLKRISKLTPVYEMPINHIPNLIAFLVIMTAGYIFFRTQELAYLSSRLIVLFSLPVGFGWLIWIIYYTARVAPSKRRHYLERERFFRYLPKVAKERNK